MVRLLVALLSFVLALSARADDAAYANMQRAVGGIIQQQALARGFSVTDPRTYGTLYGVGKVAVSGAAGVGAGFLVAGSAPAWATVLAFAAISAGVSYAVSVGLDAAVKWAFGSGSTPVAVTSKSTATSFPNQIAVPGLAPTDVAQSGTYYQFASGDTVCTGGDVFSVVNCFYGDASRFGPTAQWGGVQVVNSTTECLQVLMPFGPGGTYFWSDGSPAVTGCPGAIRVTGSAPIQCAAGSASKNGAACVQYATSAAGSTQTTNKSLADAVAALTDAQKSQQVSYDAMALMINQLVAQAAADPTYGGIPQSLTQPFVTAADVQAWANANPSAYPTVSSLTAPVSAPTTGLVPSVSSTASVAPATAVTPANTINPAQASPLVNLGPDPVVPLPTLETTPTAQMILNPLLGLFPDLKSFVVPSHAGECPKPSLSLFGRTMVMDGHCTLLEPVRPTIYAVMAAVWVMVALFIVLAAVYVKIVVA